MSLRSFCQMSKELLQVDHRDFVKFTLEGVHNNMQYVIDPLLHRMEGDEPFDAMRDFDSLLGLSAHIVVHSAITVFPVAKREKTLSSDIHLVHEFEGSRGAFRAPVHKIPNACLATWDVHNVIYILIPDIYRKDRSSFLTQEEYRILYEDGIRPAIESLSPETVAEWPANYHDELFRARRRNGQLALTSKMLAEWHVRHLGDSIREALARNGSTWGTGLVFLHQIRGVKHSTIHRADSTAAEEAFDGFLSNNKLTYASMSVNGTWYVDVGIEISSPWGNSLAWQADSHCDMVETACELSERDSRSITQIGSSKYVRDIVSHLPAVSGCRITTGRAHGPHDVPYLQLYTTDKALTYQPDNGTFGKSITAEDLLKGKGLAYVESLCTLYNNATETSKSHARIELRVSIFSATKVLIDIDEYLVRSCLVSIDSSIWWTLRSCRALSVKFLLEWQMQGDAVFRSDPSALILTAAAAWLLNGLHSAPDKGKSSRELMAAVLPHVDRIGADRNILAYGTPLDDEDNISEVSTDSNDDDEVPRERSRRDATTLPAFPYGIIFLSKLRLGKEYPVPRLTKDSRLMLSDDAFRYFFKATPDELAETLLQEKVVRRKHPDRIANRTRQTPSYYNWGQNPNKSIFSLAGKGARLPSRPRDLGSDNEEQEDGESDNDSDGADITDIDRFITKLWYQFLIDILEVGPNKKRAHLPPYIKLNATERGMANEETYRNMNLGEIFTDYQWQVGSDKDWTKVFDKLFPVKGHTRAGTVQNYKRAQYYPKWEDFKAQADHRSYTTVRKELLKRFRKLYWMPKAVEERIWWTKYDPSMEHSRGADSTTAAPRILINGPWKAV
ncbi:hypothetical protein BDZ94DRAFT_1171312 [Collybia nuda]|uniref:Uncharacterized protein n=1 Tax=Collybia nuda TaxID=64659 RepID=A0A9P6CG63_9AGAR|nr:hypothetical protein BDZ94DRAFT_1171312 [Collybia nuda]